MQEISNRAEPRATLITMQLDELLDRLSRCENSLYTAVARLSGSHPVAHPEPTTEKDKDGFMSDLNSKIDRLAALTGSMETSINYLPVV